MKKFFLKKCFLVLAAFLFFHLSTFFPFFPLFPFLPLAPLAAGAQDLVGFLPQDAMVVISLNAGKILAIPEVRKFADEQVAKAQAEGAPGLDEFVQNVGIDPMKDLKEVVILVPPFDPSGKPAEGGLTLINGTFEEARVVAALEKSEDFRKEGKIEKYEGMTAVRITGKPAFAVFTATDTLAIGTEGFIKKLVAVKSGKEKGIMYNSAFAEVLKRAKTDSEIWAAGVVPAELKTRFSKAALETPFGAFSTLANLLVSIDLGSDFEMAVYLGSDQPKSAGMIAAALQGLIPSVKAAAAQMPPELVKVLDAIVVKADGPVASLGLKYNLLKFQEAVKKAQEAGAAAATMPDPGGVHPPQIEPKPGEAQPGLTQPAASETEPAAHQGD